jgi:hypothetical protein
MDELKDKYFNTEPHTKRYHFKVLRLILLLSAFIIAVLISFPYAYSYYQDSNAAQNKNYQVQKQLDKLLTSPDVTEYPWMRSLNPIAKSIEGGIVWSQDRQYGVMKFRNLPASGEKQQYHLRLYDRNTTQAFSAAIFQQNNFMPSSRLVSFRADSAVKSPYKFILSLESRRGEEQEQVLLRAQP